VASKVGKVREKGGEREREKGRERERENGGERERGVKYSVSLSLDHHSQTANLLSFFLPRLLRKLFASQSLEKEKLVHSNNLNGL
jgi:hypothetical protein